MITKDQLREWKDHPVTQEYFKDLKDARAAVEHELVYGHSIENHSLMAQSVGLVRAYDSALNYQPDFDDDGNMLDLEGNIVE
jgi:hypothetical protein